MTSASLRLVSLSLGLLFAITSQTYQHVSARQATSISDAETTTTTLGHVDIILYSSSDGGICGKVDPNSVLTRDFSLNPGDRIIKIDETFTRGRSIKELQPMMSGLPGSTVKLSILATQNGELSVRSFVRDLPGNHKLPYNNAAALDVVDLFKSPSSRSNNLVFAQDREQRHGSDLYTAAALHDLVNYRPYCDPSPADAEVLVALPFAIKFFDQCGMFDDSDSAIDLALKLSKRSSKTFCRAEIQATVDVAHYLGTSNRLQQANQILNGLYATISDARVRDQIIVLNEYGNFLDKHRTFGVPLPIYQQLESSCAQAVGPDSFLALKSLARYYRAQKNYVRSVSILQTLLEAQRTVKSPGPKYLRYQDQIMTLSDLATVYADSNNLMEAAKCLNRAIALYTKELSAEDIVLLERSTSPCLSEVETQLGQIYVMTGKLEEARKVYETAIARIEDALGRDAPPLKSPVRGLATVYENQGNADKFNQLSSRFDQIPEPASLNDSVSNDFDCSRAREAFAFLNKQSYDKAQPTIDELLESAKRKSPPDPHEISTLVSLAKRCASSSRKLALLMNLRDILKPYPTSLPRATVLAEIACLISSNGEAKAKSEAAWNDLEDCLSGIESLVYSNLNDPNQGSNDELLHRRIERLVNIAHAYRFFGEPQKAALIVQRALNKPKLPASTRRELQTDLVICQIELKNFRAASDMLNAPPSTEIGSDSVERLRQIADAYALNGKPESAETVLSLIWSNVPKARYIDRSQMLFALASLEYRLGHYEKAVATFIDANKGRANGAFSGRDLGNALAALNRPSEAIEAYLNAADWERRDAFGNGIAGLFSLSKALTLLDTQVTVKPEVVANLLKVLNRLPRDEESVLTSEQIVSFAQKALPHCEDAKVAADLRLICEHEGRLKLAVEIGKGRQSAQLSAVPNGQSLRDLAVLEINSKNYDKAGDYLISLLESGETFMMPHPGNRQADLCLQAFKEAGRLDVAERILLRATQLDCQKTGDSVVVAYLNAALLVDLYAQDRKSKEAQILARQVLDAFDAHPEQIFAYKSRECSSTIETLFWAVDSFVKNKELKSAELLNKSISGFLDRHTGLKNQNRVRVLEKSAAICGASGDKKNEEKYLSDALRIASWNWGPRSRRTADLRLKYASVLRELNRKNDAESVQAIEPINLRPPAPVNLYGPHHIYGSHSPPPDAYADTAGPALREWLEESSACNGEASDEAINTIGNLIDFHLARKQYAQAEQLVERKLEIWREIEGPSSNQQSLCMKDLAVISLMKDDKAAASAWLKKAESANVYGLTENLIECGAARLEMGDKAGAVRLLLQAAKAFEQPSAAHSVDLAKLGYLLTQAGETQEVAKLTKLYKEKYGARRFGMYGWNRNGIEPDYEFCDGAWIRKTRLVKLDEQRAQLAAYRASRLAGQRPAVRQELSDYPEVIYLMKMEDARKNFATARIAALQQAEAERTKYDAGRQYRHSFKIVN